MRVGLVIYGSLETLSGGYLYDRKLVEYLRRCGDEVVIVSQPWQNYPRHLLQNFSSVFFQQLAHLNVDVLVQDELNHPSLVWLNQRLRRRVSYPIISIVHHLRSSEVHPRLALALYRQVERAYLRTPDGFIFNSCTTRAAVQALSGEPVEGLVATPAGDRLGAGLSDEKIAARCEQPGPLRLLFVGNLIRRKGLETVLAGLAYLPVGSWRLRVVGRRDLDPSFTAEIDRLAGLPGTQGQVEFLGALSEESLRAEFCSAQALVMPSQYEGFGIVYLEGLSFGLPALASTAGAAGEILVDGESGFLVPVGDSRALAERVSQWTTSRLRLLAMSLAARRRFDHFPGWEASMAAVRAYLVEIGG